MIVVTGAGGFIGSNLIAKLETDLNEPIVACDVFGSTDKWRNVRCRRLYNSLSPEQLFPYLEANQSKITTIFHLGAISSTTETDVDLVLQQNLRFSHDLLRWCERYRVRLIYASSAATYGDGTQGFDDGASSVTELLRYRPLNPYAWSKHLFDMSIAQIQEGHLKDVTLPPQIVGLKFFNVYGPNEYHKGEQMSLVPQFYKQICETGTVKLFKSTVPHYPDGGQLRDFIHVNDCVDVMVWFYEQPQVSGLFNVGTGKSRSFNDLAHAVFHALEKAPHILYIDMPDSLKDQYQSYTQATMEKLHLAGYTSPFLSLEEGVTFYVREFLMQKDPYR